MAHLDCSLDVRVFGLRHLISDYLRGHMSRLAIVSGVCTSLVLGTALLAVAQDEHRDQQNQDRQNQERQNVERPAENRQQQQGQTQEEQNKNRQQQNQTNVERQNREPENSPRQGEMRPNDHQQNNSHEVNQGGRQEQARPEDQARGGHPEATSRRIPDSDFRAHFGREHRFAPGRMEVYEGRPRFFYSGYTFELLDPWPSDWAYDQDDCYVDYADDGYWLYNDRYPGERVAVILVG